MPKPTDVQLQRAFLLPPERAVAYLEGLGVEITWDWREQLAVIRRQAFTVAKVTSASLLNTLLTELRRGSDEGKGYKQWASEVGTLLEKKGYARKPDGSAWRLENIYRTNMQTAYQAGRYTQMRESERFQYWEYRAVGDKRSRSEHLELDGLILHRDHPMWKRIWPPNGFGCRCSVTALTLRQAVARGYREPKGTKVVTSTGRIVDTEAWQPDEGFDGIPGQPYEPDTSGIDPKIGKALDKEIA